MITDEELMRARAFVTGSRAYGTPRGYSDVDLVVFVTEADLRTLRLKADPVKSEYAQDTALSLRFGGLNLLVCTDAVHYQAWSEGARMLKGRAPVTRDQAVEVFKKLRDKYHPKTEVSFDV